MRIDIGGTLIFIPAAKNDLVFSMIDILLLPSFVSANLEIMLMYKDIDVDLYFLIDVNETKN